MTLIGRASVAHELGKTGVAGDGSDFVGGATGLGQSTRCSLPKTVSGAMRQARLIALVAKPMTERRGLERPIESSRQERQVAARRRGDDSGEIRMYGDRELGSRLLLL